MPVPVLRQGTNGGGLKLKRDCLRILACIPDGEFGLQHVVGLREGA